MVDIEKNSDDTPADEGGYILKWTHGQPEGHDYTILTGPKYRPSHLSHQYLCMHAAAYKCLLSHTPALAAPNQSPGSFWLTATWLAVRGSYYMGGQRMFFDGCADLVAECTMAAPSWHVTSA